MKIGARNSTAGLFSHLNFIITKIDELGHADFHVDWTEGNPYVDDKRANLFDFLFQQKVQANHSKCQTSWPHYSFTGNNAANLYLKINNWRWRLHHCWALLNVNETITNQANEYCKSLPDRTIALHIRNTNISVECPNGIAPTLAQYARALHGTENHVYLATDNKESVDFFRNILGDRLHVRCIERSPDMNTEYHLTQRQTFLDARECLLDALIMSRCSTLIHSVSNIATAVLYINPEIPHIFVTHATAKYLPTSLPSGFNVSPLAVLTNAHVQVIYISHYAWNDWLVVRENNYVERKATGCIGIISYLPKGDISIKWRDWGEEYFERVVSQDPKLKDVILPVFYKSKLHRQIFVRLEGGMGDQMFQYAAALRLAKRNDMQLIAIQNDVHRSFALTLFGVESSAANPNCEYEIAWHEDYSDGVEQEMLNDFSQIRPKDVKIAGYFQNENYFVEIAHEIKKLYNYRYPLPSFTSGRTVVAIHIKLDDRSQNPDHQSLPVSYYTEALSIMRKNFENPIFLVFLDEPEKCPTEFLEDPSCHILPLLYEFQVFGMMCSCDAFIIANSTFSWWPAWLSDAKHVICPSSYSPLKKWNICPLRWEHIDVTYET